MVLGWPALSAALLLSASGAWLGKPALIWVGVVLTTPMALYLSGSPAFPFIGVLPVIGLVGSALTCRIRRKWLSATGVIVYVLFLAWLAYIVTTEP